MAHVLDSAGKHHVGGPEPDLSCGSGHGRERARAHAVDSEAGDGLR
jgi:hypothetical protein